MSGSIKEDTGKSVFGNAPFEKQEKSRIQDLLQPSNSSELHSSSRSKSSSSKFRMVGYVNLQR